ncbi:kinase-like domain-containing protein [Multifurca ochricompacta]|uniref:Kinase-like domain-containing protein n=1 Tax=Multifurca ochricompacta TaxID=376703 RepID=A0AAD4LZL8_9AGAM|nr:kinase-like domain-containing protein [Multifurca ochricompacta]
MTELEKLVKDIPPNLPILTGPNRKLDSSTSGAESDFTISCQASEGTQRRGDIFEDRSVRETLRAAGYKLTQEKDCLVPIRVRISIYLFVLPHLQLAHHFAFIVLKLLNDDSNELEILRSLSAIKLPENHAIKLHGVVDLGIGTGTVIVLPWRMPLAEYCISSPLPWSAEPLENQFLEGVAFLHEHNIAHLDLKVDNVLIDIEGDKHDLRLWIIDFGLSVFVEDEGTTIKGYRGTPEWTAPEVGTLDGPSTRYSPILADRWACGRMLDYFEKHLPSGHGSQRDIGRLGIGLLREDPRSRPSVREVLDGWRGKAKDGTMKRSAGEDWSDGLEKRARISCVEDIVDG